MTVSSVTYLIFAIYLTFATVVSTLLAIVFLPLTIITGQATGGTSSLSFSSPQDFLLGINDFIQGIFAGQLVAGSFFTNFMLITILGFVSMKLFISFSLYETKLVPTR
eukprot:SAG22_NODE_2_length_61565_cov_858.782010_34_plen_108_part_00